MAITHLASSATVAPPLFAGRAVASPLFTGRAGTLRDPDVTALGRLLPSDALPDAQQTQRDGTDRRAGSARSNPPTYGAQGLLQSIPHAIGVTVNLAV